MSKNPLEQYLTEKNAGKLDAAKNFARGQIDFGKRMLDDVRRNPGDLIGHAVVEGGAHALGAGALAAGGYAVGKLRGKKEEETEKKAGIGELLSKAKQPAFNAAVGATTMGALTAGTAAMSFGAKKLYDAITKKRDFRQMLEANPDLHEHLEKDPKFFNQAYSSLRSVNPQFASEPMIAGHYMRHMMEFPDSAGGKIELALQAASQGHSPTIDATMRGVLQGATMGMNRPHDPHSEMESEVRGLTLQRRRDELMTPQQQDPHAPLEQQVRGLKLQRDMDRLQQHFQGAAKGPATP